MARIGVVGKHELTIFKEDAYAARAEQKSLGRHREGRLVIRWIYK